ncbi:nuclear transport factor 2 [Citrus sinensis]|uniref:nuclear transport factor 2 n=1 Tax=Citrus sinensis TaxID=2711 RepID=UPI00219077F9|nr:nuclear transport factor 2 [Citrus sinensis]XP_052294441.1 nuclear transport factor 2 [Citrus sinensis]KAH9722224.1 nuclear transport factor 2 [Citrus sinensis]
MAVQEGSPAPSAQVVGNAFVEQYYHILHQSPGLVHRFYQDSSLLSRPDSNGSMTTVTTMKAINDRILSLNYEDYTAEIKTADAQDSYEKGVIVLVTGCLTGKDNVKKKFTQTFFLAPQDKGGYFVLNDVFRFVEENESLENNSDSVVNETAPTANVAEAPEPAHNQDHIPADRAIVIEGEDLDNGPEVCDPSDKEEGSVVEDEIVEPPTNSVQNEVHASVDSAPVAQGDAPEKKSYASIVKVMKGYNISSAAYVPARKARPTPPNADQQSPAMAKPAPVPEASALSSDGAPENSNVNEEAEGCSIYVRNLAFTTTSTELEEAFKIFGPIKKNGVQVRSNKQGYCFGFVAFETPGSVQSALEASPILIGDRPADVEAKRANSRVGGGGGGRGRFSSGRVGFRSDSFKGRGNFGGGRGYGRNEFRGQGEFSGRPKGSSGRNGDGRANQNGNRRGGPQGGVNRNSVTA